MPHLVSSCRRKRPLDSTNKNIFTKSLEILRRYVRWMLPFLQAIAAIIVIVGER